MPWPISVGSTRCDRYGTFVGGANGASEAESFSAVTERRVKAPQI